MTPMRRRSARCWDRGSSSSTRTRPAAALQHLDGAGLAGPVRPEDGDHLPGLDDQVEAIDRHGGAVADDQAADLDGGHVAGRYRVGEAAVTSARPPAFWFDRARGRVPGSAPGSSAAPPR